MTTAWSPKDAVDRKARLDGRAEQVAQNVKRRPAWLDRAGEALRTETYETAKLRFPGYDIYFVEGEWRSWASGKEPATDPNRAFLAFFKKFAERNPL